MLIEHVAVGAQVVKVFTGDRPQHRVVQFGVAQRLVHLGVLAAGVE